MAVNDNLLLYIEPKNPPSKEPLIDELTCVMTSAFRQAKSGTTRYSGEPPYEFQEGNGWRGWHTCSCGAHGGGHDHLLPNGEITNKLCIHYLAYHRDEISEEQLKRVANLFPESDVENIEIPNDDELTIPKGSEGKDINKVLRDLNSPEPLPKSRYGDKRWVVGWNDRGMGRGDYAVIEEDGTVIAKVETNAEANENVHLMVKACNHHKELIAMVEKVLDIMDDEITADKNEMVSDIDDRLAEIKNHE